MGFFGGILLTLKVKELGEKKLMFLPEVQNLICPRYSLYIFYYPLSHFLIILLSPLSCVKMVKVLFQGRGLIPL